MTLFTWCVFLGKLCLAGFQFPPSNMRQVISLPAIFTDHLLQLREMDHVTYSAVRFLVKDTTYSMVYLGVPATALIPGSSLPGAF